MTRLRDASTDVQRWILLRAPAAGTSPSDTLASAPAILDACGDWTRPSWAATTFAPEELLFQIDRMFSYPGTSEMETPWWIGDWDHERDDAVVIGVEPVIGRASIGLFSERIPSPRGATGVVALPDRESFAVHCGGAVYRVSAASPGDWEEISAGGVEAPVVASDHELVLFVEHTAIVA
jgi:hypothetical protein